MKPATSLELLWRIRDLADERIRPPSKAVLYAIVAFAEQRGLVMRPSLDQIARGAGTSRATAIRVVADLETWGYLVRDRSGGRRQTVSYQLTLPEQSQAATAQRSHAASAERLQAETPQTSHGATSHGATAQESHAATRVVAIDGPSGLTLRPSEDHDLKISSEDPPCPPSDAIETGRSEHRFALGSAAVFEACNVFAAALETAGKATNIRPPFERQAIADAMNTKALRASTVQGSLTLLSSAVGEWTTAYAADPQLTGGWRATKFLDWLNAERPAARRPMSKTTERQGRASAATRAGWQNKPISNVVPFVVPATPTEETGGA